MGRVVIEEDFNLICLEKNRNPEESCSADDIAGEVLVYNKYIIEDPHQKPAKFRYNLTSVHHWPKMSYLDYTERFHDHDIYDNVIRSRLQAVSSFRKVID